MSHKDAEDGPSRIPHPDYGKGIVEKFSDTCSDCAHTRADHLVSGSVSISAVNYCNRCGKHPLVTKSGNASSAKNAGDYICERFA